MKIDGQISKARNTKYNWDWYHVSKYEEHEAFNAYHYGKVPKYNTLWYQDNFTIR
jgi:hypothetical protein